MSLTEKQLTVIDDLFDTGGDETAVLQKHLKFSDFSQN